MDGKKESQLLRERERERERGKVCYEEKREMVFFF